MNNIFKYWFHLFLEYSRKQIGVKVLENNLEQMSKYWDGGLQSDVVLKRLKRKVLLSRVLFPAINNDFFRWNAFSW